MGRLIPAGTGFKTYRNLELTFKDEQGVDIHDAAGA
jgi:hypothetical protein